MLAEDTHAFVECLEVARTAPRRGRSLDRRLARARLELLEASHEVRLFEEALRGATVLPAPSERDVARAEKHAERMRRVVVAKTARLKKLEQLERRNAARTADVTYRLHSDRHHVNFSARQFAHMADLQQAIPVRVSKAGSRCWWWYRDRFWWEDEGLSALEIKTRVVGADLRRHSALEALERARTDVLGTTPSVPTSSLIPDSTRRDVWHRDMGRCVDCGVNAGLVYDFIIPIDDGGSSAASNIELRCRSCRELRRENEARANVSRARVRAFASHEWRG